MRSAEASRSGLRSGCGDGSPVIRSMAYRRHLGSPLPIFWHLCSLRRPGQFAQQSKGDFVGQWAKSGVIRRWRIRQIQPSKEPCLVSLHNQPRMDRTSYCRPTHKAGSRQGTLASLTPKKTKTPRRNSQHR